MLLEKKKLKIHRTQKSPEKKDNSPNKNQYRPILSQKLQIPQLLSLVVPQKVLEHFQKPEKQLTLNTFNSHSFSQKSISRKRVKSSSSSGKLFEKAHKIPNHKQLNKNSRQKSFSTFDSFRAPNKIPKKLLEAEKTQKKFQKFHKVDFDWKNEFRKLTILQLKLGKPESRGEKVRKEQKKQQNVYKSLQLTKKLFKDENITEKSLDRANIETIQFEKTMSQLYREKQEIRREREKLQKDRLEFLRNKQQLNIRRQQIEKQIQNHKSTSKFDTNTVNLTFKDKKIPKQKAQKNLNINKLQQSNQNIAKFYNQQERQQELVTKRFKQQPTTPQMQNYQPQNCQNNQEFIKTLKKQQHPSIIQHIQTPCPKKQKQKTITKNVYNEQPQIQEIRLDRPENGEKRQILEGVQISKQGKSQNEQSKDFSTVNQSHQFTREPKITLKNNVYLMMKSINEKCTYIIGAGQVANYCSNECSKENKLWVVPAFLLYKYCTDFYEKKIQIYQSAQRQAIIDKQVLSSLLQDISVIKQNCAKIYKKSMKTKQVKQSPQLKVLLEKYLNQPVCANKEFYIFLFESIEKFVSLYVQIAITKQNNMKGVLCAVRMLIVLMKILNTQSDSLKSNNQKNSKQLKSSIERVASINYDTFDEEKAYQTIQKIYKHSKEIFIKFKQLYLQQ